MVGTNIYQFGLINSFSFKILWIRACVEMEISLSVIASIIESTFSLKFELGTF